MQKLLVCEYWAIWSWLGKYHLGRLKASESNWINKIIRDTKSNSFCLPETDKY